MATLNRLTDAILALIAQPRSIEQASRITAKMDEFMRAFTRRAIYNGDRQDIQKWEFLCHNAPQLCDQNWREEHGDRMRDLQALVEERRFDAELAE